MDNINFEELAKSEADKMYYVSHCVNNSNSVPIIFEIKEFGEIVTINGADFSKNLFNQIIDEYFHANDYFNNFLEKCEKIYYAVVAYMDIPESCEQIETVTATFRLVSLGENGLFARCDENGNLPETKPLETDENNKEKEKEDKFAFILTDIMIDNDPNQLIDPVVINEIICAECELDFLPILYENYFGKCLEYINSADTTASYSLYPKEIRRYNGKPIKIDIQ